MAEISRRIGAQKWRHVDNGLWTVCGVGGYILLTAVGEFMRRLWVLSLVGACTTQFNPDAPKVCSADFSSWAGGLTTHLMNSEGGAFDYAPASEFETRVYGNYEFETGDFWWVTEYEPSHYRAQTFYDGFGTAWEDGDLDIRADVQVSYANESKESSRIYERRLGCDVDRRVVTADADEEVVELEEGTFDGDEYAYERTYHEEDRTLTVMGSYFSDQYRVEELDNYKNGTYRLSYTEQSDATGLVRRDFVERWTASGFRSDGHWELLPTGITDYNYTVSGEFTNRKYKYSHDLDGVGDGTVKIGSEVCDVRVKNHKCTYTCGDDERLDCD